jgi:hypothetical protein
MSQLRKVMQAAIQDLLAHGFDSEARMEHWVSQLRTAIRADLVPESQVNAKLTRLFGQLFAQQVGKGRVLKLHQGLSRFTLDQLAPRLHHELDRRILASANLIKLNRARMMEETVQRFAGWSTSIPPGGTRAIKLKDVTPNLLKPFNKLPFEERRVHIDQGHKLISDINDIIASDKGAIAQVWHSHWRRPGYNYRVDHKERDGLVYLIRGSWAHQEGLVKAGQAGYSDQVTKPAEEVFCSCYVSYIYNLRDLPADMLTAKGRAKLQEVKAR